MQLKAFQKEFDPLLITYLEKKISQLLPYCESEILKNIVHNLIPYQHGGKRIRPFLVKTIYDAFGGAGEDINQIAISNELLHAMALVHDDIIDLGETRHGQLTYHKKIQELYHGSHQAGISQGILVGDWLLTWSLENITFSTKNTDAIQDFFAMIQEVVMGEMIDVHFSYVGISVTPEEIMTKDKLKSGYYTFMRPMKLGGILAGVERSQLEKIVEFGDILGLGYQMRDDYLDVTGTHGHENKTRFSDLSEGNQTIVWHEILNRVSDSDRDLILSYRGKSIDQATIQKISSIVEESGALPATATKINTLLDQSQVLLDELITSDKKEHTALSEIIDYLRI